jgi:hypothetical protein
MTFSASRLGTAAMWYSIGLTVLASAFAASGEGDRPLVAIPVIMAALPLLMGRPASFVVRLIATLLLGTWVVATGFSVGRLYLPGLTAMLIATAFRAPRRR